MSNDGSNVRTSTARWFHFGKSLRATLLLLYTFDILILGFVLAGLTLSQNHGIELKATDQGVELIPVKAHLRFLFDNIKREIILAEQSILMVHRDESLFANQSICQVGKCAVPSEEDYEFMLYSSGRTGMSSNSSTSTSFASLSAYLYLFDPEGGIDELQIHLQTATQQLAFYMPVRDQAVHYSCGLLTNSTWAFHFSEQAITICKYYSSQTINMTVLTRVLISKFASSIEFNRQDKELTIKANSSNAQVVCFQSQKCQECNGAPVETEWLFPFDNSTVLSLYFYERMTEDTVNSTDIMASTLALLFLFAVFAIKQRIHEFCRLGFGIINNICNILRTSLDDAFSDKSVTRDHILLTNSSEIQKLAIKFLSLSTTLVKPKKNSRAKQHLEPLRLESRLKAIVDNLSTHLAPKVTTSVEGILNSREILRCIKGFCQEQTRTYKELLAESTHLDRLLTFYSYAYNSLIMGDTEKFKEFALQRSSEDNSEQVNFFYYVNHMIRTKSHSEFVQMGAGGLSDIVDDTPSQLRPIALLRIQSLLLSKFFIMIKESDANRQYICKLSLSSQVEDLEQEVQNNRYELSERNKLYQLIVNKRQPA